MPPSPPAPPARSETLPRHAQELMRHLDEPIVTGNRVSLLQDGPATFDAMFGAVDAARDHINIESYIVEPGGPGDELAERLASRCRAGVKVNLLFDSFGSLGTSASFFERLRAAGVTLCEYNPVQRWRLWMGQALHLRDHRKLMVVDGRRGFIGGVNISAVYSSGSSPLHLGGDNAQAEPASPPWRDLHLSVEGPAVHRMQRLFVNHWQHHATCAMPSARYFPPLAPVGHQRVALAACEAGRRHNPYYSALIGAITQARRSILLTTAYLVPTRRLVRALCQAAERGVLVDLLLPGLSDFWAPLHAGRSHYQPLLRAGVRIHERHDRLLHAKACVIDGEWCSVGSSNADWRSVVHNAEADLIVLDEAFARDMEKVFRADVARSDTIDPVRWAQRPRWRRWKEAVARRFEFFL